MITDLSRLLRPASIAVIGGGWGLAVVEQCLKMGFQGDIWPVHPTRAHMHGVPCLRALDDLPAPPDAVFIAVNRHQTIEVVRQLGAMGAGGAVCFASGFAEAEDDRAAGGTLQVQLVEAAGDMPILGPNCYGLINYLDGALLWPDQHGGTRLDSGVAILTQSSNMLINITMQQRGLPIAYALAAGNQAQTGLADMAMALMDDPRVTAIGLHIEGVGDIRAFEAMAAKARTMHKPLVALKVGRSAQAQAATISHTASLAGGNASSSAFLRRLGIPALPTLPAFLETLTLLHVHGALPGRTLCSMSCSGGEASLIADAALDHRVAFRPLTGIEHDTVKATLSDLVTVANPLDYHTFIWNDGPRLTETYTAMLGCGFDLSLLIYDFPRLDRCDDATWTAGVTALTEAARRTGARAAVVATLPECLPEDRAQALIAAGIAPLHGLDDALSAIAAAADLADAWTREPSLPLLVPGPAPEGAQTMDEIRSKSALASQGMPVPAMTLGTTPEEAGAVAEAMGFPVALKAMGIAHKTEAGAVRLNLTSAEAVTEAAAWMHGASGFLVETMIAGAIAELIIGVVRDPAYGFALTVGSGGVLTELLDDTATILIPATEAEIAAAIASLKMAPTLTGYRGRPKANMQAITHAVIAVQNYVYTVADTLLELDVNPLIVTPDSALAADALIRLGGAEEEGCSGH